MTGSASEKSSNRFNWTRRKSWKNFNWNTNQGDLRVDLTEPEKVFDIAENLTAYFLKGKGQSYAMHGMDQAMMFSI